MSQPSSPTHKTVTFTEVLTEDIALSTDQALVLATEIPAPTSLTSYSAVEVARHSAPSSLWLTIAGEVYDVTEFQWEHPGGAKLLQNVAGGDATVKFRKYHRDAILLRFRESLRIGVIKSDAEAVKKKRWLVWKR